MVEPDYEQCEISWITKAFCAHCLGVEADFDIEIGQVFYR